MEGRTLHLFHYVARVTISIVQKTEAQEGGNFYKVIDLIKKRKKVNEVKGLPSF